MDINLCPKMKIEKKNLKNRFFLKNPEFSDWRRAYYGDGLENLKVFENFYEHTEKS
jgi:hypothetical protein